MYKNTHCNFITNTRRMSKHSYSDIVRNLLACDASRDIKPPYQKAEEAVNPVEKSSRNHTQAKSKEFKYVDTLRMSKRKQVKFSIETVV